MVKECENLKGCARSKPCYIILRENCLKAKINVNHGQFNVFKFRRITR